MNINYFSILDKKKKINTDCSKFLQILNIVLTPSTNDFHIYLKLF